MSSKETEGMKAYEIEFWTGKHSDGAKVATKAIEAATKDELSRKVVAIIKADPLINSANETGYPGIS